MSVLLFQSDGQLPSHCSINEFLYKRLQTRHSQLELFVSSLHLRYPLVTWCGFVWVGLLKAVHNSTIAVILQPTGALITSRVIPRAEEKHTPLGPFSCDGKQR